MTILWIVIAVIAGIIVGIVFADKTNILSAFKEKEVDKYSFGRSFGAILCLFYMLPSGINMIKSGTVVNFPDIPQNLALLIAGLFGITAFAGAMKKKP